MENVEIEKKWLVDINNIPFNINDYPFLVIEQAYLNTRPVIRIRRSNDDYYLTYKGSGMMKRTEYNLPLNKESYEHMLPKADGKILSKKRYMIPYGKYTIELDEFFKDFKGLFLAEVEFSTEKEAEGFIAPEWFSKEVTLDKKYHNSNMAKGLSNLSL